MPVYYYSGVPTYAKVYAQNVSLYPRQGQVIYPGGTVITPSPVVAPGTVIAPGTVVTPGNVISPGTVYSAGTVISPGVVQTGGVAVVQAPQVVTVHTVQNGSGARDLAKLSDQHYYDTEDGRSFGGAMAAAVKSGVAQEAARGFVDEMDKTAKSPLLDCFMAGSGVQLRSKLGGGIVRVQKDGSLDCKGSIGNDFDSHFLVSMKSNNQVVLQNGEHNAYHLTMVDGLPATAYTASYFKLHETWDHYVTLCHSQTGQFLGVDSSNQLLHAGFVQPGSEEAKFEVYLAYSPYGHTYEPSH